MTPSPSVNPPSHKCSEGGVLYLLVDVSVRVKLNKGGWPLTVLNNARQIREQALANAQPGEDLFCTVCGHLGRWGE